MQRSRVLVQILVLLGAVVCAGPSRAQDVEHVFIVVIDGLRAAEGFDDPDHTFVGPMVDELLPQGSLLSYLEIRGQTLTLPAHQVFVTGTYADCGNTWAYEDRLFLAPRVPTIFDAYRQHTGAAPERSWVLSNTPLVGHDCEHTLMPGYDLERAAASVVDFSYTESDDWVWDQVEAALDLGEVDLMLVNLHEVDRMGHSQDWDGYLDKAFAGSTAAVQFWDRLQADPVYADNTVLLITTDHGRHREDVDNGFIGHGDACTGCRQVFLLALGPGIRQGFVSGEAYSFLDIAPTVAHLLDVPFPYHRGRVITDILTDGAAVDPGPGGAFYPQVAAAGDMRVRAYEFQDTALADNEGAHQVVVELSVDGGETWTTTSMGGALTVQRTPMAWTDGEVALVGWQEYTVKGEEWYHRIFRIGDESTEWEDVFHEPMSGSGTPVASALIVPEGDDLYLFEGNPRTEVLRLWMSDDRGYTWSENIGVSTIRRHFPRDTHVAPVDGAWVLAYSAHTAFEPNEHDPNENTEIFWQRSDDLGQTWTTEDRMFEDSAPSIQPSMAVGVNGTLHLVWADMASGAFELFHAASTDGGQNFSTPLPLTFDSVGAWEPALAADGERLYAAWSQFDALDSATIQIAALDDDTLVEQRQLSTPGRVARQPHVTPLGDCTSWVTWSESDLQGPWELGSAVVATAGVPVTAAEGAVEPAELIAGGGGQELVLTVELEIGEEDRGVDGIEVVLPEPLSFEDGTASVDVDGDPVDAEVTAAGHTLWFELEEPVVHDGGRLDLRLGVDPGDGAQSADPFRVFLHLGAEPCSVEVSGDLGVDVVLVGDDDDATGDDDDVSIGPGGDNGCECDSGGLGSGGGLIVVPGLLLGLARRRDRVPRCSAASRASALRAWRLRRHP